MKKILLVCGSGASSGFMAGNLRKAVKARGIEMEVMARSDSEVEEYLDSIDMILVGPHLEYLLKDLSSIAKEKGVSVHIIKQQIYGSLDGNKLLDFILELSKEEA
jgi:PTS system cellobiose-specific IIB component